MALLLLAVAALLAMALVAVVAAGQYLVARAEAATAADAAALAAAPVTFRSYGADGSPRDEAARFATANGARLVACRCPENRSWEARIVEVTTEVAVDVILFGIRTAGASSRASFIPPLLLDSAPDPGKDSSRSGR